MMVSKKTRLARILSRGVAGCFHSAETPSKNLVWQTVVQWAVQLSSGDYSLATVEKPYTQATAASWFYDHP